MARSAKEESPGYTNESLRMLESEEGQLNAVFACFGSAAQHAQMFEQSLVRFLTIYNRVALGSTTVEDVLQKMTMGKLLKRVEKVVTFPDDSFVEKFDAVVRARNFLMHDFFIDRASELESSEGRMALLTELITIEKALDHSRVTVNAMRIAMCRTLGIEDEWAQDYSG